MNILAIETSCDETAAAVVSDGRTVLSSIIRSQSDTHALYGGVVPEIASRAHTEAIVDITRAALDTACCGLDAIDAVAVTCAPGLIGALLTGVSFAKGLAYAAAKPLIPVHHIRGHIAANYIAHPALEPPFVCLVVSGGHTMLVDVRGYTDMSLLGSTRDDAAGEAFDKVARVLGLPYPGGPSVQKLAEGGDPFKYSLPRTVFKETPCDFSFSGLKTAVINLVSNAAQRGEAIDRPSLAASFTRAVSDVLTGASMRAVAAAGYKRMVIAGGVAANTGLRSELALSAGTHEYELYLPPPPLCIDNAAMIASAAYYESLRGDAAYAGPGLNAYANMNVDLLVY